MHKGNAIITGGNRGLGFATAEKLLAQGYRVFITARELKDGEAAAELLRARVPGAEVVPLALDLARLSSVRDFAAAWRARGEKIDRLILNAGIIGTSGPRQVTSDGFELMFGTNHLGHFLLTELLLDHVKAAARSRIVVVSSTMHIPGMGPGKGPRFDFDDLQLERDFEPVTAYRNSKLANVWFTYELARRLAGTGVTVNALCPGFVPTTAAVRMKGFQRFLFSRVLGLLPQARTVEQAATHIAWVATSPSIEGETGRFYADQKERKSSDESYDELKARRLWQVSEELTRVRAGSRAVA